VLGPENAHLRSFHANQSDGSLAVKRKAGVRENFFAHHDSPRRLTRPDENCLAKINADGV